MLILAAILITLLSSLAVLGLSFSRLRPGYLWILVTTSTLLSWVMVIMSRAQLPILIPLVNWQPDLLFAASPIILVDNISWPFATALITLPLAVLFTEVTRVNEPDPQTWSSIQALGGVGLIAVIAGNPLTMLMAWAVIDITEILVLLLRVTGSLERERVVTLFFVRIVSMGVLVVAILRIYELGKPLTFDAIPAEVGGYLMLAAGLRLGIFPTNKLHLREQITQRGLGTMVRFVQSAASLVLLVRAAHVEISGIWMTALIIFATLTAIFSAFNWVRSENELQARPYWVLGLSAFAFASASLGLPVASASWGLAMLFSGALLFLSSVRGRWLLILFALGGFGFSALPLTPSWEGAALFFALPWGSRVIFFISLALLLVGYQRFARQPRPNLLGFDRWMWLVYPLGLALLPVTHFGLVYVKWILGYRDISFQSPGWWSGIVSFGLGAILIYLFRQKPIPLSSNYLRLDVFFEWAYRIFWWGYRTLNRVLYGVTRLVEGEGSLLWALLILILLIVTINIWGSENVFEIR